MSLTSYLAQHHVEFECLPHPPAFSAPRLAEHLHVPGAQVAKAVLLRGSAAWYLAVLPSTHQVNSGRLSRLLGEVVRLARVEEMAQVFPDCEFGRVPPFGRLYGLTVLLDEAFPSDSWLIFEGQTCVEAIRLRCRDFERLEAPRRLGFAGKQFHGLIPCVSSPSQSSREEWR